MPSILTFKVSAFAGMAKMAAIAPPAAHKRMRYMIFPFLFQKDSCLAGAPIDRINSGTTSFGRHARELQFIPDETDGRYKIRPLIVGYYRGVKSHREDFV